MKTCREVVEQITYKDDLGILSKVMINFHLFICKKCARTNQQINNLDKTLRDHVAHQAQKDSDQINKIIDQAKRNLSA